MRAADVIKRPIALTEKAARLRESNQVVFEVAMGANKIESQGPQNHAPDRATIARRFEQAYGSSPW